MLIHLLMDNSYHISKCPEALAVLPACSVNGHMCSTSCLTLWFDHLKKCNKCQAHIEHEDKGPFITCDEQQCMRIKALWELRSFLIELLCTNNLKPDGYFFNDVMEMVKIMLKLDYQNVRYSAPIGKVSSKIQLTKMAFEILAVLKEFQDRMLALGLNIAEDLSYVFLNIVQNELIPYF